MGRTSEVLVPQQECDARNRVDVSGGSLLGSGTHLSPLTLQASHTFLAPLIPHPTILFIKTYKIDL